MSRTLKILLADDHSILRTGLKLLLSTQKDFKVVAEASNGKEVLSLLDDGLEVDVILLDLSMPVMSGLDCLRELNKRQSISSMNVLVLTMHNEQQYIKEVMLYERKMPDNFINERGNDVTQEFVDWCRPLIGDPLPEFLNFKDYL